jgi:hypothetical protein
MAVTAVKLPRTTLLLAASLACIAAPSDKKLAIVHTVVAQSDNGLAIAADDQFRQGETLYFSFQVEGYKKVDKPDDYGKQNIHFKYQIQALDSRGAILQPVKDGSVETTVSSEDKNWLPVIRDAIVVPPLADSGEYAILVKLSDELSAQTAEARVTFSVKGHDVAPSDTLVVRNFRFVRQEDDDKALPVAAYRPGDAVWARFDMTGYKLGTKNQVDIEYGLTVLRADGSVAYSEPQAATQKIQTFYPQRYQPGTLNLSLAKDQPLGNYTIVLAVRDNLGQQMYETRETFSVE